MKRIQLAEHPIDLQQLLLMAHENPVVVVTSEGTTYMVALADDFDQEVEQLRQSRAFQAFLDSRTGQGRPRRSLAAVTQALETEITAATDTE